MVMNIFAGPILLIRSIIMLLSSSKLIKLSLIPGLVSGFGTVGIFFVVDQNFDYLVSLLADVVAKLPMFGELISDALSTLDDSGFFGSLMSVVLSIVFALFLVMLIALPLCEPLAAEVDRNAGGEEIELGLIEGILSGIGLSIKLIVLGLSVSIVLTIASIIPVIGFFAGIFNIFCWTPFILSLDITDFVFGRRAYSLSERFKILRRRPLNTISVGLLAAPLLATPFLNLIGAPIVVIMGTLYARQLETDLAGN